MSINQFYNAKNEFQGSAKKVLCVCSAGLLRSPTAANVLHKEYGYNTRAVGCDLGHALIPITKVLCYWADEIVVMEFHQKQTVEVFLKDMAWSKDKPIICLNVPDEFEYMNTALQKMILTEYNEYLLEQDRNDTLCEHKWYDVHHSGGDHTKPTGRRCEKCNKQEWY
jgi:predicted protein tyrosine phosphatase